MTAETTWSLCAPSLVFRKTSPDRKVEVISDHPGSPQSIEHLGSLAGTSPYEIVCGLGPRVERRVVEHQGVTEKPGIG